MTPRRLTPFALSALLAAPASSLPATACPFCASQGTTFSQEVTQADFIVFGTMKNARRDPDDFTKGATDLHIESVVKPHDFLKGKKVVTLPRYVPLDPAAGDSKILVFGAVYNGPADLPVAAVVGAVTLADQSRGQIDAYRGEPVTADSVLPKYLKGAEEVRQKDAVTRLRYFFDYLDAPEVVISEDAYKEFGNADYKEVRELAGKLPAGKVLGWLKDPNTPASRYGLYGLLVGHAGRPDDAKVIRQLLDNPDRLYSSGLDGMLAGYILLDPKGGTAYLTDLIRDEKKEFTVRYAGLKVLRFFWEFRPDVMPKPQVIEGMKLLAAQADLADLPIEDLRKWGCWEQTPFVLRFGGQKSHNKIPIVKRAVLRFALSAQGENAAAKEYVAKAKATNAEWVKDVEELLREEQTKPATPQVADQPTAPPAKGAEAARKN